ncbi:MAG: TIGR00730 family Rossman fold protein [Planctomycetota bacterium]
MPLHVCVFCSSTSRSEPAFGDLADEVGRRLAEAGHTLVFGGGSTGLMGRLARSVHAHKGRVIGVIPESMKSVEIAYLDADELVVTQTMRERKQVMDDRADAFLILPGGFGTLEELSEVITHRYLKFHDKPIVILNPDGFYNDLLVLFDHFIETGMAKASYREAFTVTNDIASAVKSLGDAR